MSHHTTGLRVPEGLRDLLSEFTYKVLKDQPASLTEFGYDFFSKKTGRDGATNERKVSQIYNSNHNKGEFQEENEDDMEQPASESDHEDFDPEEERNKKMRQSMGNIRRQGVAAESFDPEAVDDYERVVHPKTDEQRERLRQVVAPNLIFRSLEEEQLGEVIDAVYERQVEPDEVIIRQGDDGDNFYVIEKGLYDIYILDRSTGEDKLVGKYDNKGSFGELALMYNCPRAATVIARTEGIVWVMDRETFRRIVLIRAFQKRQKYENLIEKVPMLQELSHYERMNVADALKSRVYQDGEVIIEQGAPGNSMFFIESGHVKVVMKRQKSANDRQVNYLGENDYFGELALLTKQPRVASIVAHGECRVAELDVDSFERLLGPCEDVMKRNIDKYKEQLEGIFGSLENLPDFR